MKPLPAALVVPLGDFRARLEQHFPGRVEELRLFGSWARRQQHEESDVDVLVSVRDLTARERDEIYRITCETDDTYHQRQLVLSPLVYPSSQVSEMRRGGRRLFREIDAQGIAF
jgi:hypothetical protein